jgi:CRP-like cAMP-binding protein
MNSESKLFSFIEQYMPLTSDERQMLSEFNLFHFFEKGMVILEPNDSIDMGFFVLEGCIRCYYVLDGEEKTTNFYTELEVFTPASTDKSVYGYYAVCLEDSLLVVSDSNMGKVLFEKFPRFEALCRLLSEKLVAKIQSDFDIFKLSSPEERYLHLVENRPDLIQRVPQHFIASYLGITPVSLSRIRGRLAKKV